MSVFNLLRLAWRALLRNKMRALLTMLGIIIGVAAVIAMIAIGEGSKQSIRNQLSGMGANMITIRPFSGQPQGGAPIQGASNLRTLKLSDIPVIRKSASHVSAVSPYISSNGQVINAGRNWPTSVQGVGTEYLIIREWSLKDGVNFSEADVRSADKVCLLGQTVVDNLFDAGEDPVGKTIRFRNIPIKVIGILNKKGESNFGQDQDDVMILPFSTMQKRILAIDYIQSIYAAAIDEASASPATDEITAAIRDSHNLSPGQPDDFSVRTQAELISTMSSTSELLTVLLGVIAGISLLVGGIGIMNIMYVSVTERIKEIGLRMSLGARGRDILLQFLVEAIMISITGAVIGVLLGILATKLVTVFLSWPTLVTESSVILSFAVCAFTGVFFGYYPAQKASRLNPIEALRYE